MKNIDIETIIPEFSCFVNVVHTFLLYVVRVFVYNVLIKKFMEVWYT
jgi:hypothetical protein